MAYLEYKIGEMPWVESIPMHWGQIRNGALFSYHQDKVGEHFAAFSLLSLTTQGVRQKNINDVSGKVPASYEGYQEVYKGDMVFCLFDLDCSAVFSGISDYHGMITSAYDVMTPITDRANPYFLDYWFKSVFFGRYYKIFAKSVRYTINYDIFKALKTPIPPMEEQDQIVRYLDWQVSQINRLIHGYQKQIKLIEEKWQSEAANAVLSGITPAVSLKDSDIMGFGKIPSHWRTFQNKRVFRERSDRSETGAEELLSVSKHFGVKPYSALEDDEKFATIKPAESLVGYKKVSPGNLAMNIMRARNGSYGMSEYEGIVSPAYCVYETIIPVNPRYMHYLLKTPQVVSLFEAFSYGICEHRRRLYAPDFLRISIPLPPVEEQKEIADFLEQEREKIEFAIAKIKQQITFLKEYRTRLISDVVTGQKDVRDIVVPEYEAETDDIETEDTVDSEDMESEVSGDE